MQLVVRIALALGLTGAVVSTGFSQVAQPGRIPQQIIINGQQVNGAYVPSPNGGMQSYTCPSPQEYVTADGATHGWACYESATGVWLLNALPPAPQPVAAPAPQPVQQPAVIYQAPPPAAVVYTQPATVVYTEPARTVIVQRPVYPASVVIGAAVINAAGRIASAAILGSHHRRVYYSYPVRGRRRY
jgi:hypothetical protein